MTDLKKLIYQHRIEKDMRLFDMANIIGVSSAKLSGFETRGEAIDIDAAGKLFTELNNSGGWISVDDRKAPCNVAIDIFVDYQDMNGRVCNCFYNPTNNKFWHWDDKCKNKIQFYAGYVTHWMPLPAVPSTK